MPIRIMTAVLALLALLLPTASYAEQRARAESTDARMDRYLDAYVDANHVPGLAVAFIDADGAQTHLLGEDGDGREVGTDTPFLIGSVAKTMTATVVMKLQSAGKLSLDDHVSDHLDFLRGSDPTIEQLLTHTAGFSSADGLSVADRHDNDPGAVERAVRDLEHTGTTGEYEYTSADFLVLGAVVEAVTAKPYAEVLENQLLTPLGMDATGATAAAAEALPPGHRLWWGRPVEFDPDFDESGTPYASVITTLSDLTRYARAQLGVSKGLPAAIRDPMQRPHVESSRDHYGLGWSITEVDGTRIVHHTGATPGYFTHVLLVPEEGVAVVLLANTYAESRAPSLAAAARDIWRITHGDDPELTGGDPVLSTLPWILSALVLLGAVGMALSRRTLRRRGLRVAVGLGCLVLVVALWMLPGIFGQDLRALRIWMPDAAWSLIAGMATWSLAAVGFLVPRGEAVREDEAAPEPA
ncbi:hypothetical protein ASG90_17585 [Nocardioides sp. Soil797]|nr:hypothetical protein ASG90_17585 [Nocardioides sp. Soil797]